jgi:hypothetical protein
MVTPRLDRRRLGLAALPVLALVAWWLLRSATTAPPAPARPVAARSPGNSRGPVTRRKGDPQLEAIGLARLDAGARGGSAGRHDIFDFGPLPTLVPPPTEPPPTEVPVFVQSSPLPTSPPGPPPLNVKYIGAMEDKQRGLKIAILLTDRQEILTGRAGDVVANRLKIVTIGLESVDVQDVGAQSVRRLPLKGN